MVFSFDFHFNYKINSKIKMIKMMKFSLIERKDKLNEAKIFDTITKKFLNYIRRKYKILLRIYISYVYIIRVQH